MDNIKMDLKEMLFDDVEWIKMAQDKDHWYIRVNVCDKLLSSAQGKIVLFKTVL
jgi:hypothetical protein